VRARRLLACGVDGDLGAAAGRFGGVKIGQFDMADKQRRPDLPTQFERLDNRFFSLGQDADYYEEIGKLDPETAEALLASLNDVVADEELYLRAREEKVTGTSLMRYVNERTLVGQFRRVVAGGARLTDYTFRYRGPVQIDAEFDPVTLVFKVDPFSKPPSNIQVIIGRNGVGKSHLLNAMSRALVAPEKDVEQNGEFIDEGDELEADLDSPFANIVSVTFSAISRSFGSREMPRKAYITPMSGFVIAFGGPRRMATRNGSRSLCNRVSSRMTSSQARRHAQPVSSAESAGGGPCALSNRIRSSRRRTSPRFLR
jgi:hypothetical protein